MKKLLITSVLIPQLALAQPFTSNILILGGGGEPKGTNTIFDNNLTQLGDYFKSKSWNYSRMAFNGGHSETEEIITRKFTNIGTKSNFTENQYNLLIDDYTDKISRGLIGPGSNLMLYVDTHGGQKEEGQLTHSISLSGAAITDTTTAKGSEVVSMDKLLALRTMARNNGVKLAIIDLSCHSGASQALADENTCVISSTGPNHLGYTGPGTFGDHFVSRLKSGRNLEEVFLEAREVTDYDNGTPMISTPEDRIMNESLYEAITPYLYHANPDGDKLGSYLTKLSQEDLTCHMQKREEDFKKINKFISEIEAANRVQRRFLFWTYEEIGMDLSSLKENIKAYKDVQDKMLQELKKTNTRQLQTVETISVAGFMDTPITLGELFRTNYEEIIAKKDLELLNAPGDADLIRAKTYFIALKRKKEELAARKPDLFSAARVAANYDKMVESTYNLANRIKRDEKLLYNASYNKVKKENAGRSNPCRDFVL